jgi:hypothetical protein
VLDASSQRSLVRGNVDCWQTLQPQVGERLENRTKRWRCGCLRATCPSAGGEQSRFGHSFRDRLYYSN